MEKTNQAIETVTVSTKTQVYTIYIGQQLCFQSLLAPFLTLKKVFIISDDNVSKLYLLPLREQLSSVNVEQFIMPAGECSKSMSTWQAILNSMLEAKLNRDSLVIALGGGVVGDIAGFAASCYQRGLSFIQIPTSLLAQVDSSVGGKTAINFQNEKNVIGSFYQPKLVLIDVATLKTLPERDYIAGLAEVIKYGLLADETFFDWLLQHFEAIKRRDLTILRLLIARCCAIKAEIVEQDETEQGSRALLNLGHTFGHALESISHYQRWLHGEAVAMGLYLQAILANQQGYLAELQLKQIKEILAMFQLPYSLPNDINLSELVELMYRDKKVRNNALRLVITVKIGQATIIDVTDKKIIMRVLNHAKQ